MSDYTSKRALVDSIMKNVLITTEEGFELRGEIVDLIKNQPTFDEKEIIRKAFERVVERLEEEKIEMYKKWLQTSHFQDKGEYLAYKHATEICKEEGGIE